MKLRNPLTTRRARNRVIIAARLVASSYEPHLDHQYDPDDLYELRQAVAELRGAEGGASDG